MKGKRVKEQKQQPVECKAKPSLAGALLILQERWVLFIVNGLMDGPLGFNELSRRASGVNTTTLSQRMDLLEKHGIVEKTVFSTIPPRTSYKLTGKGRDLKSVIEAISKWADRYVAK